MNWVLSGGENDPMIRRLHNVHLGSRSNRTDRSKAELVWKQQMLMLARIEDAEHFYGLLCVLAIVCAQTCFQSDPVFYLLHDGQFPCLMLVFCEIVYVYREQTVNTKPATS